MPVSRALGERGGIELHKINGYALLNCGVVSVESILGNQRFQAESEVSSRSGNSSRSR